MPISYEAIEGTKPAPHVEHEPRTLKKVITPGPHHDDHDLHMMTEIGDGVFVAWTNCRACSKRVGDCKCAGGPVEPPYMVRWRQERFEKELNARPDPPFEATPKLIAWLRKIGYTVTKPRGAEEEPVTETVETEAELKPEEPKPKKTAAAKEGPEQEARVTDQVEA